MINWIITQISEHIGAFIVAAILVLVLTALRRKKFEAPTIIDSTLDISNSFDLRSMKMGGTEVSSALCVLVNVSFSKLEGGYLGRLLRGVYGKDRINALPLGLVISLFIISTVLVGQITVKSENWIANSLLSLLVFVIAMTFYVIVLDLIFTFPFLNRQIKVTSNSISVQLSKQLKIDDSSAVIVKLTRSRSYPNFLANKSIVICECDGDDEIVVFSRNFLVSYAYTDKYMEDLRAVLDSAIKSGLNAVRSKNET